MSDPHDITVRAQTLGGQWEIVGVDRLRGIVPESVQLTANEWGPDTCSFALRGPTGPIRADLSAWTPIEIDVAGRTVWDGRITETPTKDGPEGRTVSVQAQGWQYHLDDDVYTAAYVRTSLGDWQDVRQNVLAYLPSFTATPQVNGMTLQWANGTTVTINECVGVLLDSGPDPAGWPKRISVDWTPFASANASIIARCADSPAMFTAGGGGVSGTTYDTAFQTVLGGVPVTQSGTFANPRRYVAIFLFRTGATAATASDYGITVTGIRLYTSTTYESADQSTLTADTIIKDSVVQATDLLSSDVSGFVAGTIVIPEFSRGRISAREAWQAANAFENYDTRIEVGRRPVFRPRPTVAVYEIGEWAGADFQDASVNSGQDIVNRVLVEGSGPDGLPLEVERTTMGTLPDRRGFRRTMILQAPNPGITTTVGQRFGDLYLQAHRSTPFRGGFQTVGQGGVRRVLGGGTVHPAHLLGGTTQLVRCPVVDVDTGNWTRDARMVSVSYDHDSLASTIALDEDRDGFDTLLARYSVVASQPR